MNINILQISAVFCKCGVCLVGKSYVGLRMSAVSPNIVIAG